MPSSVAIAMIQMLPTVPLASSLLAAAHACEWRWYDKSVGPGKHGYNQNESKPSSAKSSTAAGGNGEYQSSIWDATGKALAVASYRPVY